MICVCTRRRPALLDELLGGLARQEGVDDIDVRLVVVDNDPGSSARSVVERRRLTLPMPVAFCEEPRGGLSVARNAGVARATRWGASLCAFIDDDEVPDPRWLVTLLTVLGETGASAVGGPVHPVFPAEGPPSWVAGGGFFVAPGPASGEPVELVFTGNMLVTRAALVDVAGSDGPFDPRFSTTGGEDTHLALRLRQGGHRLVWAREAIVHETVPRERLRLGWLARRALRANATWTISEREVLGVRPPVRALKGLARLTRGMSVVLLGALLLDRQRVSTGLLDVVGACGTFVGLTGYAFEEYATTTRRGGRRPLSLLRIPRCSPGEDAARSKRVGRRH